MGWSTKRGRRSKPTSRKGKKGPDLLTKSRVVLEPQMRERWDKSKTVKQNYEAMGLVADPNKRQAPAENPIELVVPASAPRDEPRLYIPEIINTREMINKHGVNYLAMWRDRKVNPYQHTRRRCQKMVEMYLEKYALRDPDFKPSAAVTAVMKTLAEEKEAKEQKEQEQEQKE